MKLTKLTLAVGLLLSTKSFYKNHIKSSPEPLDLTKLPKKEIIVVGAGIVGLSTAYYLS